MSIGLRAIFGALAAMFLAVWTASCGQSNVATSAKSSVLAIAKPNFELQVVSSNRFSAGTAEYTLLVNGKPAWTRKHPFTLDRWVIADDGAVFGYAFTQGREGFARLTSANDEFQVWKLDPKGTPLLLESKLRQRGIGHGNPMPYGNSLAIVPGADCAVVAVLDGGDFGPGPIAEQFWTYKLSDGTKGGHMPWSVGGNVLDLGAVPSMPLLAVASATYDPTVVTVNIIDPKTSAIAKLDMPLKDKKSMLFSDMEVLFPGKASGEMAVWIPDQKVSFMVENRNGLTIHETGRVAYDPVAAEKTMLSALPIVDKVDHTVTLTAAAPASNVIQNVRHFIFAGPGRIAYVEGYANYGPLALVDTQGKLLGKMNFPKDFSGGEYIWLNDKRFLITQANETGSTSLLIADLSDKSLKKVDGPNISLQMIRGLARFKDGSIAVACMNSIIVLTPDLKKKWDLVSRESDDPADPGFLSTIASTKDDRLIVLDGISKKIQVYDNKGKHLFKVDLQKAIKTPLDYPNELSEDVNGGFVLGDFHSESRGSTMYRFDRNGKLLSSYVPHYADGRTFYTGNSVRGDGDGNVWTSDEHALLSLNSDGSVKKVLGEAPSPLSLGEVADLDFGPGGDIYVRDMRTDSLFVFDSQGKLKWTWKPDPKLFDKTMTSAIDVTHDGTVYMAGGKGGEVVVASAGAKVALFSPPRRPMSSIEMVTREAAPGARWLSDIVLALRIVNSSGVVMKDVKQRSDRGWIQAVLAMNSADDGSVAIVDQKISASMIDNEPTYASVFDSSGKPISSFKLPTAVSYMPSLDYDGKHILIEGEIIFDTSGKAIARLNIPDQSRGYAMLDESSGNVAVFDGKRTISFYKVP